MGDFIANTIGATIKIVIIYYVFYWLGVVVFGGAACMGCATILKSMSEDVQQEQTAPTRK